MTPEQVQRACEGDDAQLETLLEALLPVVKAEVAVGLQRRARLYGRDPCQDVDDLVHDVMVQLLADDGRLLQRWDPARGRSLTSFVRLVARCRVARVFEGFRGNPWGMDKLGGEPLQENGVPAGEAFVHQLITRDQLTHLLERLYAQLNPRGLLLFELLHVQQTPIVEVCEIMGMTRAAVDQWNVRLRQLARRLVEDRS